MCRLKVSREQFLQTAASAVAGFSLPRIATGRPPASPAVLGDHALISQLNPVRRLYADKAIELTGGAKLDKLEIALQMFGPGGFKWNISVADPDTYDVALCYSGAVPGSQLELRAGASAITQDVPQTEGFYLPGESHWGDRRYLNFERVPLNGELRLSRGVNAITLQVNSPKNNDETFRLRSVELTPHSQEKTLEAAQELGRSRRASTDWFVKAGYGVWFHFLDITAPRRGPLKSYPEAVDTLDVEALASLVEETGAGYVIFNTNHGHPTCPAPIKSWEELHPGWTTRRDLIADLADAFHRRGIRLLLYMNCPGLGNLEAVPGTARDNPTVSEEEYAAILTRVFTEIGLRYRDKVAGYWLDSWHQTDGSYPNLPFDKLFDAIKAGNPDRLISYNTWAFPIETDWQEYWCGELTYLPAARFKARYIQRGAGKGLQSHAAIRLDAPWFHIKLDSEMEPPVLTEAQLIGYVKSCNEDEAVVSIGVGIFQDGTIGEQSRQLLKTLRRAIRKG